MVHMPSTKGVPLSMAVFDISLMIPAGDYEIPLILPAIGVSAAGFKAQGIDGLIGRDVLSQCYLSFSGRLGNFTLAY